MSAGWEEFNERCQRALEEQTTGHPDAFKALWSSRDDIVIMGADGVIDQGADDVRKAIDWASSVIKADGRKTENLVTIVGEDMALTVDVEKVVKEIAGQTREIPLRCTQVYRLEDGEWRVILRHADEYGPKGPRAAGAPGGGPPGGGPPGGGPPG